MPVINKTMQNGFIDINKISQDVAGIKNELEVVKSGVRFIGEFPTEEIRDELIIAPNNGDLCYITASTVHSGSKVQYIYNEGWIYGGGSSNVNDASETVKGIVQLSGDLAGNSFAPTLKPIITGGTYAFGNNTVTLDTKGRVINVSVGESSYEWVKEYPPYIRTINTKNFTVPSYNINSAIINVYYNGLKMSSTDFTKINSNTIVMGFTVYPEDTLVIENQKFIGSFNSSAIVNDSVLDTTTTYSSNKLESDFAKLNADIIPTIPNVLNIGDVNSSYDTFYCKNAPVITSDRRKKKNIQDMKLGLEFVNCLQPRIFQMSDGVRWHNGYIADEFKKTMDLFNVDFGAYIKDENKNEALRYEEIFMTYGRAIQELTPWYKKLYYKIKKYFRERKVTGDE